MPPRQKTAVVAAGGNSLIIDEQHKSIPDQYATAATTSHHIADMIEGGWDVVITHGNGPQVGFILRRSEMAIEEVPPVPMDYTGADTQGAIGYIFQRAMYNKLRRRSIGTPSPLSPKSRSTVTTPRSRIPQSPSGRIWTKRSPNSMPPSTTGMSARRGIGDGAAWWPRRAPSRLSTLERSRP